MEEQRIASGLRLSSSLLLAMTFLATIHKRDNPTFGLRCFNFIRLATMKVLSYDSRFLLCHFIHFDIYQYDDVIII
jgi:hypothetical protein